MNARVALGVCALSFLCAADARAFSEWRSFEAPPASEAGGGGGRFFTGVPTDSYTCEVCHVSERRVPLEITGLPLDGYEPNTFYTVEIRWPANAPPISIVAEAVVPGGPLEEPPLDGPSSVTATPEQRCLLALEEGALPPLAASRIEFEEGNANAGRGIVRVDPCGATEARVSLKTPDLPAVYFGLSAVQSDDSSTPEGDAVFDYHVKLQRIGEPSRTAEGCSAHHGWSGGAWSLAMALGLLTWRQRRASRKG